MGGCKQQLELTAQKEGEGPVDDLRSNLWSAP